MFLGYVLPLTALAIATATIVVRREPPHATRHLVSGGVALASTSLLILVAASDPGTSGYVSAGIVALTAMVWLAAALTAPRDR